MIIVFLGLIGLILSNILAYRLMKNADIKTE